MKSLTLAAALLVSLNSASALFAGAPYEELDAGEVFVATITRVEDKDATNARPPRVWLEVHEVLRGEAKVARSPALWSPPDNGFDWGDGNQPELKRWYAAPLKGPKVGQKFILGGRLVEPAPDDKDAPAYDLFGFVRIPYSDEARAQAIAGLATLDEARRKHAAEKAAEKKERELRGQKWRAAIDDAVIDRRTQQADAVAIGQISGGSTFRIETLLKGQPRMTSGGTYNVTLPEEGFDRRIADLVMYQRPRCILFLSEENLIADVTAIHAQIVDPYEGIVPADAAAIAAVKASLQKRPAPKPRPVLVISALDKADAASLAEAARNTFTVVMFRQSAHGANSIVHVRNRIPNAGLFVMIDSGPQRRVVAVQITPDTATTIYEATWPDKDAREQLQALTKKLVETTN